MSEQIHPTDYLFKRINELQEGIDSLKQPPLQSEETGEIATAFAAAQLEYPQYIGPNRDGFFLKSTYTDIPGLRKAIFPILAKHGLSFRQYTNREDNGTLVLTSILHHSSGQFFGSRDTLVPENATQRSYGTCKKYIRRQQMMALLQCDPFMDEEDDDGQGENKKILDNTHQISSEIDLKKHSYMTVTPEQIDQLEIELDGWPELARSFFKSYEITRVADLRRSAYDSAFKRLLEIKSSLTKDKK